MNKKCIKDKIKSLLFLILYCSFSTILFIILISSAINLIVWDIEATYKRLKKRDENEH